MPFEILETENPQGTVIQGDRVGACRRAQRGRTHDSGAGLQGVEFIWRQHGSPGASPVQLPRKTCPDRPDRDGRPAAARILGGQADFKGKARDRIADAMAGAGAHGWFHHGRAWGGGNRQNRRRRPCRPRSPGAGRF